MIAGWSPSMVAVGQVGVLFAVAWAGDRYPLYPQRSRLLPIVYSLALTTYCSSWTSYGAVGTAGRHGLG